jgi:hypothetical protein
VHRLVHRDRRLAEARRDELELPRVRGDVARRVDPGPPGLHLRVHHDLVLLEREPPLGERAEVADEAEHREHDVGRDVARGLRLDVLEDHVAEAVAVGMHADVGQLVEREQRGAPGGHRGVELAHGGPVRAEPVAAVHQRHVLGAPDELRAPVERRVAAADDHHPLAPVVVGVRDHVVDAAPVPPLGDGLRQPARAEGADARRDDDGARRELAVARLEHEVPRALGARPVAVADDLAQPGDRAVQVRGEAPPRLLLHQAPHEILRQHLRVAGDVEDVLLRVERRELAAELRQGVDDLRRRAAHAGVERGEQPGGAAADDGEVRDRVHGGEANRGRAGVPPFGFRPSEPLLAPAVAGPPGRLDDGWRAVEGAVEERLARGLSLA